MSLKLLTFDLDHTLWNPDAAIQRGETDSHAWLAAQVPAFGEQFPPPAFLALRAGLREQQPQLKHQVSEMRRVAFRLALQQCGVAQTDINTLAEQAFNVFWQARQQVDVFAETRTLLAELSQHYTLGALSNGNACLQTIGLGDCFAFHFAAENFTAAKPAPDMFVAALAQAGVAADEAMHIGDHPVDDMRGAQAVGMKTLWVNLTGQDWPLPDITPDARVQALTEIPHILRAF